jgi:mRNA interferase RelE/StbE
MNLFGPPYESKAIRVRIGGKIDSLKKNPTPQGVKLLKGKGREAYRIRVGDYRILYQIEKDILTILVIKIGHRREVYRGI